MNSFGSQCHLTEHIRCHTGENPFICCQCNKTFRTNTSLTSHMRIHTGEKPFTCITCNRTFSDSSNLYRHAQTHTKNKPFVCHECRKTFSRKETLDLHIRTHTGEKPFVCDECKRGFTSSSNLVRHQRSHTGSKSHVCPECKNTFTRNDELAVHMRIHTGERPFQCAWCNKTFSKSGNMLVHIRTHSGIKPHICNYTLCGAKFTRSNSLKAHIRAFHTETGRKRQKRQEERFFRSLKQQYKIDFNIETEREVEIDFKCAIQNGTYARLDGFVTCFLIIFLIVFLCRAKIREKDLCEMLVEVDEHQHNSYNVSCECNRTTNVAQSRMIARPDGKRLLIRFNPHGFSVNGQPQRITYKERLAKFVNLFQTCNLPTGQDFGIVYMFYDSFHDEHGNLHLELEKDPDFTLQEHIVQIVT